MTQMTSGQFGIIPRGKRLRIRAPCGLEIIDNSVICSHHEIRLFCNLSLAATQRLSAITSASSYPKGTTLFVEGESARGVFIVCAGRVKLSTCSTDGKTLIVRIAETGEVLGLPGTVTGRSYELTADAIEPTQTKFISRTDFLGFLREYSEAGVRVAQQLGESYHAAIAEMRSIALSRSVGEKLARFLLDWAANHANGQDGTRVKLKLTHEEIAQMIGSSREAVTRHLVVFKKKQFVQIMGSTLIISNRSALEKLIESRLGP